MNYSNQVTLSGLIHHLKGSKKHDYFAFSIRHEEQGRRDFLNARAFEPSLQEKLRNLPEDSPVRITGVLHSSIGSGELYLAVQECETVTGELENSVKLSGAMHVIKAQTEGETGLGRYTRFAVKQESTSSDGRSRRDFLVVRVYDEAVKLALAQKQDGDPVTVEGTLRSSRGSGVNYVLCSKLA